MGRAWYWGRSNGADRRSGSAPSTAGGRRSLLHLLPYEPQAVSVSLPVGIFPAGLSSWTRVRHMHRRRVLRSFRRWRCRDFFPAQRLAAILHFQSSVGGLVHLCFGPRTVTAAGRQQLQGTSLVTHHPVVAHPALRLQTEDVLQLRSTRFRTVVVFRARRVLREALVQRGKIRGLQIGIGGLVRADVLAPEFLHQTILVHTVFALHTSFGLRRVGPDDADP